MKGLHEGVLAWICFFGSSGSLSHIVIKMCAYTMQTALTTIKYVKCPKFLLVKKKKKGYVHQRKLYKVNDIYQVSSRMYTDFQMTHL